LRELGTKKQYPANRGMLVSLRSPQDCTGRRTEYLVDSQPISRCVPPLRLVEESDLQRFTKIALWVPGEEIMDNEKIFITINAQNDKIFDMGWEIISRNEVAER